MDLIQSEEEKETVNDSDKDSSGQESEVESNKESDGESEDNDTEYETDDRSRIKESAGDENLDQSVDCRTEESDLPPSSITVEVSKEKDDEENVNYCLESSKAPANIVPNDCATQTSWTYDEALEVLQVIINLLTKLSCC